VERISCNGLLLVEEDPERCRNATEVLRAARYEVTSCPEPRSAFASVCETQPDPVILEVPLHYRTGCQVLGPPTAPDPQALDC
jgi:DNA-binding response OmpR family regulator